MSPKTLRTEQICQEHAPVSYEQVRSALFLIGFFIIGFFSLPTLL